MGTRLRLFVLVLSLKGVRYAHAIASLSRDQNILGSPMLNNTSTSTLGHIRDVNKNLGRMRMK